LVAVISLTNSQIPLLLLVICAWIRNFVPGAWKEVSSGYEFVKSRYAQRALDVGN